MEIASPRWPPEQYICPKYLLRFVDCRRAVILRGIYIQVFSGVNGIPRQVSVSFEANIAATHSRTSFTERDAGVIYFAF